MEEVVLFILTFILTFIFYQFFIVRKAKKNKDNVNKKGRKKNNKEVLEITYLVSRYKLDLGKVDYNQLLQIIAITSSLDIAIVVTVILLIPNFLLEILIGLILMIIIILISYHFVYLFYKKKGMIEK